MINVKNLAKEYVLPKDKRNQEEMNKIKDKLKSHSIDRDDFID